MNNIPWSIYPRPQMQRDSFLCLNGEWEFGLSTDREKPVFDKKIIVPFAPESRASGLAISHEDGEFLCYRRSFTVEQSFLSDGEVLLHFGAVDQVAWVYLNGALLGEHVGGYLPFSFPIRSQLLIGENELVVIVRDDLDHTLPYGKQKKKRGGMWYTPVSGIWQTVWCEALPKQAIRSIRITQTMRSATLEFEADGEVTLTLADETTYQSFDKRIVITPDEPILWSPENPHLYYFTATLGSDSVRGYFALREIGVSQIDGYPRLTLNGKPYFFHALLDQGYFEDGIFLPERHEVMEEDILRMKSLGFNTLRKHIKIEPMQYYHLCDKHGMVVFQDAVNNAEYSFLFDTALPTVGVLSKSDKRTHKNARSREAFLDCMLGMIRHLYSVPSLLYYTVFNEGWGQFDADGAYELAKQADPTRIYDSTSGWFLQTKSDVDSRHVYFKKLSHKKHKGYKNPLPFVISEFGGYSLRLEGHTFGPDNYGYRIFKTKNELSDALESLYLDEVLPLIGEGLCASVLTQVSDVEDETNGLITYDRAEIKVDIAKMRRIAELLQESIQKAKD